MNARINKRNNGRGTGWTDAETANLITLYLRMVELQKAGRLGRPTKAKPDNVSKAALVKAFMAETGRTKGSIEAKLMNISASMKALGRPIVDGYKPLPNRAVGLDALVLATLRGVS